MTRATRHILLAAGLLLAFQLGTMVFEQLAFGWPFAREEVPLHDGWHWLRRTLDALFSGLLVYALARPGLQREPLDRAMLASAALVVALSVAATLLLASSATAYAGLGAEDGIIEWLSALLLFAGAGFMAARLLALWRAPESRPYRLLHLAGAAGFAALFFLMAGEEVSWFQRQIGFATPETVAAHNWQGEFNLHNFHTDITELLLYTGTGLFLMLLPLVRESEAARWPLLRPFTAFFPDRNVAAISAPMLVFTYSHWTLLPVQAAFWIGLFACLAFARTSGSRGERRLWQVLALWVVLGQLLHLFLLGPHMLAIYDSSEYRELFIAIGLAAYAWRQWRGGERLTQT